MALTSEAPAAAEYTLTRTDLYLQYLIELGGRDRYGTPDWRTPERAQRLDYELGVIQPAGFSSAFVMLAGFMDYCRRDKIPYGLGRGSVGGSYAAYCAGVHEVDSIQWGLDFERFLNPDRVSFPDVDIDVSQRQRQKVIQYIVDTYQRDDQIVLQVGAFSRAGGRAVVDAVAAAYSQTDPNAYAVATNLKKCFPRTGSLSGGVKVPKELTWWLENGNGDKAGFIDLATTMGWMEALLLLDGMFTNLSRHAAGVVILRAEDMPFLPRVEVGDKKNRSVVTGYDMYALDSLGYLKWDILGLRTLDVISDAHVFMGGSGETRDLIALWEEHRDKDDAAVYQILQEDTTGQFQIDTPGFSKTVRELAPDCFEHLVQLVALYRPGALDYIDESGRNMVQVFIERRHGREEVTYPKAVEEKLRPILDSTYGIILYQEQQMRIVRELAGFTGGQADSLRKAIGKKRPEEMAKLLPLWEKGTAWIPEAVRNELWKNIEAAARYSWNRSHAVEYAVPLWLTGWLRVFGTAGFFAAEINSREDNRELQSEVVAKARQHVTFNPPEINLAEDRFIVDRSVMPASAIVFGMNGIKGIGEQVRNDTLIERALSGPFADYADFCRRLPGVGTDKKRSLVACGAFDALGEDRTHLLALVPKGDPAWNTTLSCGCVSRKRSALEIGTALKCPKHKGDPVYVIGVEPVERKTWTVAEAVNENAKRALEGKPPKELPPFTEWQIPSDLDLAQGELDAMGYYISNVPLAEVTRALSRMSANVIGGEVQNLRIHPDRRENEMATVTITTPALTRQRVLIFASNWQTFRSRVEKGKRLLFRGRADGDSFLADGCWEPDQYRHFQKIKLTMGNESRFQQFNGDLTEEIIRSLESEGYSVRCL